MAKINNQEVIKGLIANADIQIALDKIPNELAEKIVPTFECNPLLMRRINVLKTSERTTTGLTTIYTIPADKDFFLVGVQMSNTSSATADNTTLTCNITLEGDTNVNILFLEKTTLTAYTNTINMILPLPIKLKRGSNITYGSAFTVGSSVTSLTFFGYLLESKTN